MVVVRICYPGVMINKEGPLRLVQHFGGVYIGARSLLDIKLIWFGYIARLSQCGRGGTVFYLFNDFYLPSRRLKERGEGVSTLV
jgi:hypothetical protein